VLPDQTTVIRYCARLDFWLIDTSGLSKPSYFERLKFWLWNGASADARCDAFARANGSSHPGDSRLEWHVLDPRCRRYIRDPWIRSSLTPLMLHVQCQSGADGTEGVCGDYDCIGTYAGQPVYRKRDSDCVLRWYHRPVPGSGMWLFDHFGIRDVPDCCVYGLPQVSTSNPTTVTSWHVLDTGRGTFSREATFHVFPHPERPEQLEDLSIDEPPKKRACPTTEDPFTQTPDIRRELFPEERRAMVAEARPVSMPRQPLSVGRMGGA